MDKEKTLIIKTLADELTLRKELYWVYCNILHNFGDFNKEMIEKRMEELRHG